MTGTSLAMPSPDQLAAELRKVTGLPPSAAAPTPSVEPEASSPQATVGDAIRLWMIDQTLIHMNRQGAFLGLAANAVLSELRDERSRIVARLTALGDALVPPEERRRA